MGRKNSSRKSKENNVLQKNEELIRRKKRPTTASNQLQDDSVLLQQSLGNQGMEQAVKGGNTTVQKKEDEQNVGNGGPQAGIQQILNRQVSGQTAEIQREDLDRYPTYSPPQRPPLPQQDANSQYPTYSPPQRPPLPQQDTNSQYPTYSPPQRPPLPQTSQTQASEEQSGFKKAGNTAKGAFDVGEKMHTHFGNAKGIYGDAQELGSVSTQQQSRQQMIVTESGGMVDPTSFSKTLDSVKSTLIRIKDGGFDVFDSGLASLIIDPIKGILDVFGVTDLYNAYKHFKNTKEAKHTLDAFKRYFTAGSSVVREVAGYAAAKVQRRFVEELVRMISKGFSGLASIGTLVSAGFLAPVQAISKLATLILTAGLDLYHDLKGAYKALTDKKGVARTRNATLLVDAASAGDTQAKSLIDELFSFDKESNNYSWHHPQQRQKLIHVLERKMASSATAAQPGSGIFS